MKDLLKHGKNGRTDRKDTIRWGLFESTATSREEKNRAGFQGYETFLNMAGFSTLKIDTE